MSSSLSNLYTSYFTGSDVKVFIQKIGSKSRTTYVDLLAGIGYDYNVSSIPIYTLGSNKPTFFSKGNTLGQGMLVLPFKDEQYLKAMLQHVFDEDSSIVTPTFARSTKELSDNEFREKSLARVSELSDPQRLIIDIGSIVSLFDIIIVLDASSPFYEETSKTIILEGCKITGESIDISSSQDKIVQQAYKFYFKNIRRANL